MARGLKAAWCTAPRSSRVCHDDGNPQAFLFPFPIEPLRRVTLSLRGHRGFTGSKKLEALLDALMLTLTTLHPGLPALPAPFYGLPPRSKITILLARTFVSWLAEPITSLPLYSRHLPSPQIQPQYYWLVQLFVVAENQSRPLPLFFLA